MKTKNNYSAKVKKLKNSEVEIEGEIDAAILDTARRAVLDEARKEITVPGFRKGNAPDNILLQRVNEGEVMNEAAEMALNEIYPQILKDNEIDPLGAPETTITKLAAGNPLGFKMKIGIIPEIKLGDYVKSAKHAIESAKNESLEVSDEEIKAVMEQVRKLRGENDAVASPDVLPELTDQSVKALGKFENVEDFKNKLRENMKREKTDNARKARRSGMVDQIVKDSKLILPEITVSKEVEELHRRFLRELSESKTNLEDYLKRAKRTEEDIKAQHRAYVENSLKTRLVLDKIAHEQNIKADEAEVNRNVEFLMVKDPGSDRDYIEHYVTTVLTNEAVVDFLEERTKSAS